MGEKITYIIQSDKSQKKWDWIYAVFRWIFFTKILKLYLNLKHKNVKIPERIIPHLVREIRKPDSGSWIFDRTKIRVLCRTQNFECLMITDELAGHNARKWICLFVLPFIHTNVHAYNIVI
jgi:hypothetical protein